MSKHTFVALLILSPLLSLAQASIPSAADEALMKSCLADDIARLNLTEKKISELQENSFSLASFATTKTISHEFLSSKQQYSFNDKQHEEIASASLQNLTSTMSALPLSVVTSAQKAELIKEIVASKSSEEMNRVLQMLRSDLIANGAVSNDEANMKLPNSESRLALRGWEIPLSNTANFKISSGLIAQLQDVEIRFIPSRQRVEYLKSKLSHAKNCEDLRQLSQAGHKELMGIDPNWAPIASVESCHGGLMMDHATFLSIPTNIHIGQVCKSVEVTEAASLERRKDTFKDLASKTAALRKDLEQLLVDMSK